MKFVGLAVRTIWRTMCVNINGPGDLGLLPFDLETDIKGGEPSFQIWALWVLELFAIYATDGQK